MYEATLEIYCKKTNKLIATESVWNRDDAIWEADYLRMDYAEKGQIVYVNIIYIEGGW